MKKVVRYSYSTTNRAWLPIYPADSIIMISDKQEKEILLLNEAEMDQWRKTMNDRQNEYRLISEYEYQFPQADKTYSITLLGGETEDQLWIHLIADDKYFWGWLFLSKSGKIDGISDYYTSYTVGNKNYQHVFKLEGGSDQVIKDMLYAKGIGLIQYTENDGTVWNREF